MSPSDMPVLIILITSTLFMVALFRALWKTLTYDKLNDGKDGHRIFKFYIPVVIMTIIVLYYFIFVLPKID